jgi:hypothetical protein
VSEGTPGDGPDTGGPEKLLADALRAQAVRARLPDPAARVEPEPRLLAGSADGLLAGHPPDQLEPADQYGQADQYSQFGQYGQAGPNDQFGQVERPTDAVRTQGLWQPPVRERATGRAGRRSAPLPVGWIVLLALLLGLAAGAVVGLVSIL